MPQTSPDPRELAALKAGLSSISDPIEKRNMRYEQAKRLFDETGDPAFKKIMDEENPNPIANALWGGVYGLAEGALTPFVVRDILRQKDPGIPTRGQSLMRMGGNLGGAIGGLGKASALLGGVKAAPKAIAALYGLSGAGQALGGRSEMEAQKAGQREFMGGAGMEIPSYAQETKITDPSAMMNVGGQALLSALSGGLGQKAALANKILTPGAFASQVVEGLGSAGLALNDASHGHLGEAYQDNPEAYGDLAKMVGGMSFAGALAPAGVNKLLSRPKAQAQAAFDAAPPAPPVHTSPVEDIPIDPSRSFDLGRHVLDPRVLPALQVSHMQRISGLPTDKADQSLRMSMMNTQHGRFLGQDGERILELLAHLRGDDFDSTGATKWQGGWIGRDTADPQGYEQITEKALGNPLNLLFQPAEGGGSVPVPKGFVPLSSPHEIEYTGPGGLEKGIAVSKGPDGFLVKTPTGLRKVQHTSVTPEVESTSALAPQQSVSSPAPGGRTPLVLDPQGQGKILEEIKNRFMGINQILKESGLEPVSSHEPTQPILPTDTPSLPFDLSDILSAQKWDLSKPFGTRKPH